MPTLLTWTAVRARESICLYPGNIYSRPGPMVHFVGLSLNTSDAQHIKHDLRRPLPLDDDTVDLYYSEDVFEHVPYEELPPVIAEIHRVLKPGGIFRLAMPDYRCDVLLARCVKNERGQLVFDPGGGGTAENPQGTPGNPAHLWFPIYETVHSLLVTSPFTDIQYLHAYLPDGTVLLREIDHVYGWVARTPEHDRRVRDPWRPMSIVVDCQKQTE